MRIPVEPHLAENWIAHDLVPDFVLEDVWQFPIEADETHRLAIFREEILPRIGHTLTRTGPAGLLFRFRWMLGRIFRWDPDARVSSRDPEEKSLRERFLETGGHDQLPADGSGSEVPFTLVYVLENEFMAEITNKTVFAAVHYGWAHLDNGVYTVRMAVYVKPKGRFGAWYMTLIRPFRRWIVYPAMMRIGKKTWRSYLEETAS